MNGDLVTQANVGRLFDFHERGNQAMTMAVRTYLHQIPYGCVDVKGDLLVGFAEKPTSTQLINAGLYVLDPRCLDLIPEGHQSTMPDLIAAVQGSGLAVRVFEVDEDWIDIGERAQLDRARTGE
jgi:NDP-sugar pyrophosphorylase family protein